MKEKFLPVFYILLIVVFIAVATTILAKNTSAASKNCDKKITRGNNLFLANCRNGVNGEKCHGGHGIRLGYIMLLKKNVFINDTLKGNVGNGNQSMPSFRKKLTRAQITLIYNYLNDPAKTCLDCPTGGWGNCEPYGSGGGGNGK